LSVTHYNNELGEVVEYDVYEMLDPQCLAEMTPLNSMYRQRTRDNVNCHSSLPMLHAYTVNERQVRTIVRLVFKRNSRFRHKLSQKALTAIELCRRT